MKQRKKILFIAESPGIGKGEKIKSVIEQCIDKNKYDTMYHSYAMLKLFAVLQKLKPDIIHSISQRANFGIRIAGLLLRTPVIIDQYGAMIRRRWYHIFINMFLAYSTKRTITVSQGVKELLINKEGPDSDKVSVVYNYVDLDLIEPVTKRSEERRKIGVSKDTFAVGAFGNLKEQNAHTIILHAFKQVLMKKKDAKLCILGDGPLHNYLLQQNNRLEISEHVVFLEERLEIANFINAMDLLVLPSKSEGLGHILIEAENAGLPCIASDICGIGSVAPCEENVTLIRSNKPLELSSAIVREIEKRRSSDAMGIKSEDKGTRDILTPEIYVSRLEQIYEEVTNN